MNGKRRGSAVAALIVDEAFKAALAVELAALAHKIQARDKCTDSEAIDRAMKEYDRIVREIRSRRDDLRDAQERKRREDALRAEGKPTLKTSLGDMPGFAALRAKLAAPERCPFCSRTDTHRGKPDEPHHVFIREGDPWPP